MATTRNHDIKNVLFLCTHNSSRSILAEALLNHHGQGRFRGFSAGSQASGRVNPQALATLSALGIATAALRSKSWTAFTGPNARVMDLMITVCANAAGEVCPIWPGNPQSTHWDYADPSCSEGGAEAIAEAFMSTALAIRARILALVANSASGAGLGDCARSLAASE